MEHRVLAGRYELIAKLGEGGMGSVWRAQHLALGTPLAVKLIDPSLAESSEALARFEREAHSAAMLRSVHVVQVMDYGVDEGTPFIAMELLEGETLAARLERVYRLSPPATAAVVTQVARALTRAHAAGIVHRDLKPANIFLVPEVDEDVTKVLDFGIAKRLDLRTGPSSVKTRAGIILGSPYYMSPEQALGLPVDHRSDIWSLGVIACQCLSGQRPFDKDTPGALMAAICSDSVPIPSSLAKEVPIGFDAWFARATARDPEQRFQSASEAATELRAICHVEVINPPRIPSIEATLSGNDKSRVVAPGWSPVGLFHSTLISRIAMGGAISHRLRNTVLFAAGVGALTLVGVVVLRRTTVSHSTVVSTMPAIAVSARDHSLSKPERPHATVAPGSVHGGEPYHLPPSATVPTAMALPTRASPRRARTPSERQRPSRVDDASGAKSLPAETTTAADAEDLSLEREVGF